MYIKSTASGVDYPYSIQQLHSDNPNVSFPSSMPDAQLAEWDVYPVTVEVTPTYNPLTHKVQSDAEPALVSGVWVLGNTVTPLTANELQVSLVNQSRDVRAERDFLLAESDWVSTKAFDTGSVLDAGWGAYRQRLRDVSLQAGFPTDVTWPQKPNSQI